MGNEAVIDLLNLALHGTVNSIIQYLHISDPYVPPGMEEAMETIQRLRDEEVHSSHEITEALAALDGTPKVGVFPYWNVDLNYLDVRFMARFALDQQRQTIAEIEGGRDAARDYPAVHALLGRIIEEKRSHLAALEEIAGPDPAEAEAAEAPAESADS
ncbi:MAG: ferritin-like domain-containing protein [Planctomycetota bacterium]|jgi:bacterioferritin (cytochrome b1)